MILKLTEGDWIRFDCGDVRRVFVSDELVCFNPAERMYKANVQMVSGETYETDLFETFDEANAVVTVIAEGIKQSEGDN